MSNGCICCTLREDLLKEVRRARGSRAVRLPADRVPPASPSRCRSPRPSVPRRGRARASRRRAARHDGDGRRCGEPARDYSSATISCATAARCLGEERRADARESARRADRVRGRGGAEQGERCRAREDRGGARIVRSAQRRLLGSRRRTSCRRRSMRAGHGAVRSRRAEDHPLWAKEVHGFADHVPETGNTAFVLRRLSGATAVRSGADRRRSWPAMPGVIRAKGHFWIATRPDWVGEFSLAGAVSSGRAGSAGGGSSVPRDRWPDDPRWIEMVERNWDPWADRRQESCSSASGSIRRGSPPRSTPACSPRRRRARSRRRPWWIRPIPSRAGALRRRLPEP